MGARLSHDIPKISRNVISGKGCFVADGAKLIGNVNIGNQTIVLPQVVIRAGMLKLM